MTTETTPRSARKLPAVYRGRLMSLAHEVRYPAGTRLFSEGGRADHFWIIDSGTVALDMRVPGQGTDRSLRAELVRRLAAARTRLLDLYAPYGSGARG